MKTIIISGKVIKGEGKGKLLGFPTANLDRRSYSRRKLKVRFGVYAGRAEVIFNFHPPAGGPIFNKNPKSKIQPLKSYKAAIVIGPLDERGLPKIEAHLIVFKGNLYGKKIVVRLERYLRPFKKFKDTEELKRQISKDLRKIT